MNVKRVLVCVCVSTHEYAHKSECVHTCVGLCVCRGQDLRGLQTMRGVLANTVWMAEVTGRL
jgi:hypothetical protein